jgi:hypothetical protein
MKNNEPRRAGTSLRSAVDGGQLTEDGRRKTGGAWLIKLTFGKFAVIDAEDYDRVSQYNWCAVDFDHCWYAHTFKRDGTPLSMHRLITNAPKGLLVDHIDHSGLNNRKSNLRLCTNSQNQQNKRPTRGSTSRYKGVDRWNFHKKFRARITHNGKRIHLGYFDSEIDAAKAYDKKAKELFGKFAYLNFPQENLEVQRSKGKRTPNIERPTSNVEPLRGLIQQIPPLRSE